MPSAPLEYAKFLTIAGRGRVISSYPKGKIIYSQGDTAEAAIYIDQGRVLLSVVSEGGKDACVAILGRGQFIGEQCLAGNPTRMTTATALTKCALMRIEKEEMLRIMRAEPDFSKMFMLRILERVSQTQISLADQIFSSSEKRLARLLLLLADSEGPPGSKSISAQITQEVLAVIVGTTRPRVNYFMNKFRDLGFIRYDDHIEVCSSLQDVLKERPDGLAEAVR
jgi:CRP-like cAMP-binding protein